MKIIVFDLDETLGYFTQFGIFWECLTKYTKITKNDFYSILDLYPEFIRPNIIHILKFLIKKKLSKCCHKMMIYTNNQGPKEWVHNIISYFEDKIKHKLFDHIIHAFKINGTKIEVCRTSHSKNYKDFIKCTKLPVNAEICYIDDTYYPEMTNNNIYYINLKPYYYDLKLTEMIDRFKKSDLFTNLNIGNSSENFDNKIINEFNRYNYQYIEKTKEEYEIDEILGKQIMVHLQDFFNLSVNKNNTRKNKNTISKKNKTLKYK